jgi:CheY-like chemotaxis protein
MSTPNTNETVPDTSPPTHRSFVCREPSRSGTLGWVTRKLATKILIADDDAISARALEGTLRQWGHDVVVTREGLAAWEILQTDDAPKLAILDWMMPGLEGPEICRRTRALARSVPTYIILLTAKGKSDDIVAGLESGADDYITKPFDRAELRSRIGVGERVVALQQGLSDRVKDLEVALGQVKQLKGLLPICAYCMKVRDDQNYWQRVETYIAAHSNARFSHGICPQCWHTVIEPDLEKREDAPQPQSAPETKG